MIDRVRRLRAVANAARIWTDAVEEGFASTVRPDIARAAVNRAIAALQPGDLDEPGTSAAQASVGAVRVFSRVLDGGGPLLCECDWLWYGRPDEICPACGRGAGHSTPMTAQAYRASRKASAVAEAREAVVEHDAPRCGAKMVEEDGNHRCGRVDGHNGGHRIHRAEPDWLQHLRAVLATNDGD